MAKLRLNLIIPQETYFSLINAFGLYHRIMIGDTEFIERFLKSNGFTSEVGETGLGKEYHYRYFNGKEIKHIGIKTLINKIVLGSESLAPDFKYEKVNVNLDLNEYNLLLRVMDLYFRLLKGQTSMIDEVLNYHGYFQDPEDKVDISKPLKDFYFGKGSKDNEIANRESSIIYELYSMIRYKSNMEEEHSVWRIEPIKSKNDSKYIVEFI